MAVIFVKCQSKTDGHIRHFIHLKGALEICITNRQIFQIKVSCYFCQMPEQNWWTYSAFHSFKGSIRNLYYKPSNFSNKSKLLFLSNARAKLMDIFGISFI